ncbi:MAG: S-layer protein, partial [Candidatus Micrarchaeia archaeon]
MNRLSMKRIAVLAGALLVGAAIAGPVSFSNIQIINSAGQPVVQIVVGSQAKPSDGVVAANIAAVIGNLAYTSTPVTATVNGKSAVKCVPAATATCTVTNQQVWLGESGIATASGSYGFTALIGSVLNRADKLGVQQYAKTLSSNPQYAYPETNSITSSPAAEPYYSTTVPISVGVTANYNGGGVSFSGFGSNPVNILRVTPAEVPSLVSNFGPGQENEYLWVTGFPVYDQNANKFALLDAGGALQLVFNKPIPLYSGSVAAKSFNNAVINIAGQNWTIVNGTPAGTKMTSSTNFTQGGWLTLAESMTPLQTVYVGHNISSGPFSVQVADLGQPTANGISPADINVFYKGTLVNTTSIMPPDTDMFNVSGQKLWVKVNNTFAGLYAYEKWAKVQLFNNEYKLVSGQQFNKTTNPGWDVLLDWVNTSGTGNANALQSIVIYNTSPLQELYQGQSFDFLTSPAVWKLTLVGETLPTGNFDSLTVTTGFSSGMEYQNLGNGPNAPKNITEPAQLLTVKSTIPGAFTYMGNSNTTVEYDLTPYALYETENAAVINSLLTNVPVNLIISNTEGNFIGTSSNPTLSVTITGYPSNTATSTTSNT